MTFRPTFTFNEIQEYSGRIHDTGLMAEEISAHVNIDPEDRTAHESTPDTNVNVGTAAKSGEDGSSTNGSSVDPVTMEGTSQNVDDVLIETPNSDKDQMINPKLDENEAEKSEPDKKSDVDMDYDDADGFIHQATEKGLNNDTIRIMIHDDYDSLAAIKIMDLGEDLPHLGIRGDQQARLRRWVEDLNSLRASSEFSISSLMKSSDITESPLDAQSCRKDLQRPEVLISEITNHIQKGGLWNIDSILKKKIEEFRRLSVNICVVGEPSAGKSTFINTLVHGNTKGKKRTSKKKSEPQPYSCHHIPHTVFWDYSYSQNKHACKYTSTKYTSTKSSPLCLYDAVIICSCRRFSETDLALAKMASEENLPIYFVRTKVDLDVTNEKRDRESDYDERQLMFTIKDDIAKNLAKAEVSDAKVFIVSSAREHRAQWEFPKLKKELMRNTPNKNIDSLLNKVLETGRDILLKKKDELGKNVSKSALNVVKGEERQQKLIAELMTVYKQKFGITDMSSDDQDETTEEVDFHFTKVEQSTKYRKVGLWFFLIGFFIGLIIDKVITHNRQEEVLVKCQQECEKFLLQRLEEVFKSAVKTLGREIREYKQPLEIQ